jgi:hypothetical protein
LNCCVFYRSSSFLKTLEITSLLKSGPQSAQPLIFNKVDILGRLIVRMDGSLMQPPKLAPACLGSRTRDGSHGTREKKPHYTMRAKQGYYRDWQGHTVFVSIYW